MKLIFKARKQECDFIRALIKMNKFHIFSTGRYSNMVIQTTRDEGMAENFKQKYSSAQCVIECRKHFCERPSSLAIKSKVPFI